MLIRLIAIGTRMPGWVNEAVEDYSRRLPAEIRVEWREIRAEPRSAKGDPARWMARECDRIRSALPANARIVVLDEHGADLDTREFARRLQRWQRDARPVAMLIGGPDGLDATLKADACEAIRLSSLTLAHPLVRVVIAEQLYRACSLLSNHPYHRE
ncbi:MAG: 23S rRNA (pseudouridine(1915)-N(3))-methyltransferase RlmH [Burkholderiaceae bacterium]|nr:23S rRNA (pseudouridine(1915)-N(3))-methyltransferase RlmH [Burkholderiaceae bacterium]